MGDTPDRGDDPSYGEFKQIDVHVPPADHKSTLEEWRANRSDIYQRIRAAGVSEVLINFVEAFRFDERVRVLARSDPDSPFDELEFEPDPSWQPDEFYEPWQSRPAIVHGVTHGDPHGPDYVKTFEDALAMVLTFRLMELQDAERKPSSPVRLQGHLSRRAIADVAFDMLSSGRALGLPPGRALMRLIEGLLDVNQRRQNWGRRFEARQIAIRLDAELPGQSTREVANLAGVRASTVSRWRKDPEYQQAVEHERRRRQQG